MWSQCSCNVEDETENRVFQPVEYFSHCKVLEEGVGGEGSGQSRPITFLLYHWSQSLTAPGFQLARVQAEIVVVGGV